jgi:hypothetical protein
MQDPLSVVSLPSPPLALIVRAGVNHRHAMCGFGTAALLAMGFLTAGLPVVAMFLLAFAAVSSLALGSTAEGDSRARDDAPGQRVDPEAIVSPEAHASYCAILIAFADVERVLADAPRLRSSLTSVMERCSAAVALSGRIALLANPLQRYLDSHDPAAIRSSLERLRARAEAASDDVAVTALGHAASARVRQLALFDQIAAQRDRLCARLALVHAALEAFAATIVRLQSLDDEQIVLAGESLADELAGIGEDLDLLESALEPDLAA